MKKKPSSTFRTRLNARRLEQVDNEHYLEDDKTTPVVNDIIIKLALILMVMARCYVIIPNMQGAFLVENSNEKKTIHACFTRFEKCYRKIVLLKLLHTIYELKHLAMQF